MPYDQHAVSYAGTAVGPLMVHVECAPEGLLQSQLHMLVPVDVQLTLTVLPSQVHEFEHEAALPVSSQATPPIGTSSASPLQ